MIKVCVFDLDGTVMDTLKSISYFVNMTMEKMALPAIESEKIKYFIGNGRLVLIEKALEYNNALTEENLKKAISIYDAAYEKDPMYLTKPFDKIEDELKKIKEKGISLAVLSNKPDNVTKDIIKKTFGDGFFSVVSGQKENVKKKPAPDAFFLIADALKVKTNECIMIGDTDVDMLTGNNAGARCLGVSWGLRTREEISSGGPEKIIDRVEDLAETVFKF